MLFQISETVIMVLAIDLVFLIFWIFGINKKFVASNYRKYSTALLAACDRCSINENK